MSRKSSKISRKSSGMSMPKLSKRSCKVLTLILSAILVIIALYLLNKYVFKINVRENFEDSDEKPLNTDDEKPSDINANDPNLDKIEAEPDSNLDKIEANPYLNPMKDDEELPLNTERGPISYMGGAEFPLKCRYNEMDDEYICKFLEDTVSQFNEPGPPRPGPPGSPPPPPSPPSPPEPTPPPPPGPTKP